MVVDDFLEAFPTFFQALLQKKKRKQHFISRKICSQLLLRPSAKEGVANETNIYLNFKWKQKKRIKLTGLIQFFCFTMETTNTDKISVGNSQLVTQLKPSGL